MNYFNNKKWVIVPVVILALALLLRIMTKSVLINAEEIDTGDINVYRWALTENKESWVEMNYITGAITVHMKSKAAEPDNKIRYQTVGFGVSRSVADAMTLKVGENTYPGVVAPSIIEPFPLTDEMRTHNETVDGYDISEFTFSADYIYEALSDDLKDISGTTFIYLNAIFKSYTLNEDKSKSYRNDDKEIKSWEEMMVVESWSKGSLEGFAKYYNIPIKFNPGSQPIKLYEDYQNTKGEILSIDFIQELETKYEIGKDASWFGSVTDSTKTREDGKVYNIIGAYVEPIRDNSTIEEPTKWYPPWKTPQSILFDISNETAIMPWGGMELHIVYNEVDQYANILYYKCDGLEKSVADLGTLKVGETLSWKAEADEHTPEKVFGAGYYRLIGYTIHSADDKVLVKDVWNTNPYILNDTIKETEGGLKVTLVYEKIYKNFLYYECNGLEKFVANLGKLKVDEPLGWETEAKAHTPESVFGPGTYKLTGYKVRTADDAVFIKSVNAENSDGNMLNDTIKERVGGLRVILKYESDGPIPSITPTPTPVPTITVTPTPKPTIPPTITPTPAEERKSLGTVEVIGEIRADIRGSERFNVLMGIPTTESLYTQVQGTEYNLGYQLTKKVVIKDYPIKVTAVYHLKWTDAKDKTQIKQADVQVEQTVNVKRACAYWEIENLDYYRLSRATVYNSALPGGSCIMYPSGYSPPSLVISHSSAQGDHIIPPKQVAEGIKLEFSPLMGDGVKPTIEKQDFTYEANIGTEEIKVKSDYLAFDGYVIMSNSVYTKEASDLTNVSVLRQEPSLISRDVLYKPNQVIPALTLNDVYYSTGTLSYRNHSSAVNSSGSGFDVPIKNLNSVTVHTPVICDASITTADKSTGITSNDPYVQTLDVNSGCLQLVIDPDHTLSDFTVDINNYGKHLTIPGYWTRDYAWGVRDPSVSYMAIKNGVYRNEVKFPFDVFVRRNSGEDEFIAKNTWIRFGFSTPTLYLPMWVDEGIYNVDFRTIAVNGVNTESQLSKTQTYANTDRSNYVATDSIRVQVSGRLYGLTIYDVTDYPTWETVFRTSEGSSDFKINEGYPSGVTQSKFNTGYAYDYTVGTSNQYGIPTGRLDQFTLPLVNGSHPKYKNVGILKSGYAVKFKVTATGNAFSAGDIMHIMPKFYYVDADGKNRREVDIYYTENFGGKSHKLVKMGSTLDYTNAKEYRCGEKFFGIPVSQLKLMADVTNTSFNSYLWKKTDLFTYTSIRMRWPLMTYTNTDYLLDIKNSSQYAAIRTAGVTDTDIVRRMQTFYGEYFFPADIKAVEKGFDVYGYASKYGVGKNEVFWLKDGYIIVNFDIVTEDENGIKNLSYINSTNAAKGYCSMWSMENPVTFKVSYNGKKDKSTVFNFLPGDFMVYYTDKSIWDDYESYIIK